MKKLFLFLCLSAASINAMEMNNQRNNVNNANRRQQSVTNGWQGSRCECCTAACQCLCYIAAAPIVAAYCIICEKMGPPPTARRMK